MSTDTQKDSTETIELTDNVNHLPTEETVDESIKTTPNDERIATINFNCNSCDLKEMVHYYGTHPPFVYGIEFSEPTFVMRDPFQAPLPSWKSKAEYFVAIGALCCICDSVVCKDNECSFYYKTTFCIPCARKCLSKFPIDVQQKLKKLT